MTTKISEFRLNVVPLPAPRPRVSKFGTYMPASYKVYQKAIAAALPTKPATPLTDELIVAIEFVCKPIAKSKFSTPMGDLDNFAKGVMDTLTDEGWWEDDRQIMSLLLTKRFPEPGEAPHINVAIQPTE
ncbi:RusA family crossover junction endodeoxyribonuclease [Caballeronia sp. LZ032]|uniref:RusA family crossover junction endodeoxyribonuclease n=1 Tax=Caballeronia sp. LZ032 TaxID=3038565 RepID=UPI002854524C|nr:RusA family crossover junction endodeoxyribonuclease [Caballeronia sp. LZ032]MDR5879045.1 RusA family crossover junction endodeoxyribonuclease [Caballeronia sp. LZ032]